MNKEQSVALNQIAQTIFDKKGINILGLDVKGLSSLTDYIVIAEGNVDRHVVSIAKAVVEEMEKKGERLLYSEGLRSGDWIVLDFGGIMVHLFMPGLREKYSLEKLWTESRLVDLEIDTKSALGYANH